MLISFVVLTSCYSSDTVVISNDKNRLSINFIDVGQGDAILVSINNKHMLIDSGPKDSISTVKKLLKANKVRTLDYIVATHPHEDHIGGMSSIMKNFSYGKFYAPKAASNTESFYNIVHELKSKNKKIIIAKSGLSIDLDEQVSCEFLSPIDTAYDNINSYSVVIRITYGNNSFLLMGDAEKEVETQLLNSGYALQSDLIKIAHHGSSSSTSREFIEKVEPSYAIISVSSSNSYGHPNKKVLNLINEKAIKLYRTDKDGTITLYCDGNDDIDIK